MNKHHLDKLFDEVFEDAVRSGFSANIPDPDASWNKMAGKIARQARKRLMKKKLQMIGLAAAALIMGAFIFGRPQETEAFLPVSKFFSGVKDEVLTLMQGDRKKLERVKPEGMKTSPPPEGVGPVMGQKGTEYKAANTIRVRTFEEAQKQVSAPLPAAGYLPEGYQLADIELVTNEFKALLQGNYLFRHAAGPKLLRLDITPPGIELETSIKIDEDGGKSEQVSINGNAGKYLRSNSETQLIWSDARYVYILSGEIPKEELLRMAEQIK